jgi:hypothetical protein
MWHEYKIAITVALSSAREFGKPLFIVRDCVDGDLYAVSNDSRKCGYLTAEVFACVHPDGNLIFNDYYQEPSQCSPKNPPTGH